MGVREKIYKREGIVTNSNIQDVEQRAEGETNKLIVEFEGLRVTGNRHPVSGKKRTKWG
jgi:hypothetical protein